MLLSFADKNFKQREFKQLSLGPTVSKWQVQDSNTGVTPKLTFLITMFYFSYNLIKAKSKVADEKVHTV